MWITNEAVKIFPVIVFELFEVYFVLKKKKKREKEVIVAVRIWNYIPWSKFTRVHDAIKPRSFTTPDI